MTPGDADTTIDHVDVWADPDTGLPLEVRASSDVVAAVNDDAAFPWPSLLGGRTRTSTSPSVRGVATYGETLSSFAVVPLPGRLGRRSLDAAGDAGPGVVPATGGEALELQSSVLTTLVVRTAGRRGERQSFLLAGLVSPALLRRAGAEFLDLAAASGGR